MGEANTMAMVSTAALLPQDDDFFHVGHALGSFFLSVTYCPLLGPSTGFVNFLTKKSRFGVFYFIITIILERIAIHSVPF